MNETNINFTTLRDAENDSTLSTTDNTIFSIPIFKAQLREPFLRNSLNEVYELYDAMESIMKADMNNINTPNSTNLEVVSNAKSEIKFQAAWNKNSYLKQQTKLADRKIFDSEVRRLLITVTFLIILVCFSSSYSREIPISNRYSLYTTWRNRWLFISC